jgi:hypothetical protein
MSDVFISYDSQDRVRVMPLIKVFQRRGWSVWWDRTIPPGKSYDLVIGSALEAAKCIVVVWSQYSVNSNWVKDEADEGLQRNILVPVVIDEVKIPFGFRRIQAARLVGWTGGRRVHPEIKILIDSIKNTLGPSAATAPAKPRRKRETPEHKSETHAEDSSAKAAMKPASPAKKGAEDNGEAPDPVKRGAEDSRQPGGDS